MNDDLIARVEALEHLLRIQQEQLAALRRDPAAPTEPAAERLSRRRLFARAAVGAAGVAGVSLLTAAPAAAADNQAMIIGFPNSGTLTTFLTAPVIGGAALQTQNVSATAVYGITGNPSGLSYSAGVVGDTNSGTGVAGLGKAGAVAGVYGQLGAVSGMGSSPAAVTGNAALYPAVYGGSRDSFGVYGVSTNSEGARGIGLTGVHGIGAQKGVHGECPGGDGVLGTGTTGVHGLASGPGELRGVLGECPNGEGVVGTGLVGVHGSTTGGTGVLAGAFNGKALEATSNSDSGSTQPTVLASQFANGPAVSAVIETTGSAESAVRGQTKGSGNSVFGVVATGSPATAVRAESAGTGIAMVVRHTATTASAAAFQAQHSGPGLGVDVSSAKGVGGRFKGSLAAVRLVPQTFTGAPTTGSHMIGELLIDAGANLYVCTASGIPGIWKKATLT